MDLSDELDRRARQARERQQQLAAEGEARDDAVARQQRQAEQAAQQLVTQFRTLAAERTDSVPVVAAGSQRARFGIGTYYIPWQLTGEFVWPLVGGLALSLTDPIADGSVRAGLLARNVSHLAKRAKHGLPALPARVLPDAARLFAPQPSTQQADRSLRGDADGTPGLAGWIRSGESTPDFAFTVLEDVLLATLDQYSRNPWRSGALFDKPVRTLMPGAYVIGHIDSYDGMPVRTWGTARPGMLPVSR